MFHMFRFIYPLYFDVKDIHIPRPRHIIFHENFTQKTRSTVSIFLILVLNLVLDASTKIKTLVLGRASSATRPSVPNFSNTAVLNILNLVLATTSTKFSTSMVPSG